MQQQSGVFLRRQEGTIIYKGGSMKKYVWLVLLLPLVLVLFKGCTAMTPIEKAEGDVYFYYQGTDANCQDMALTLSSRLQADNIPHFICLGDRLGERHMWIEDLDGKIYDPSFSNTDASKYVIDKRERVL